MKEYCVYVDITYSVRVYTSAESEAEAKALAEERVNQDPIYHLRGGWHVDTSAYDVEEQRADEE